MQFQLNSIHSGKHGMPGHALHGLFVTIFDLLNKRPGYRPIEISFSDILHFFFSFLGTNKPLRYPNMNQNLTGLIYELNSQVRNFIFWNIIFPPLIKTSIVNLLILTIFWIFFLGISGPTTPLNPIYRKTVYYIH